MKNRYEEMLPGARLWTGDMEVEADAIEQIRNVTLLRIPVHAGPPFRAMPVCIRC